MRAIGLLLAAALCCGSVHAAVPHQINYQGYLTATGGTPFNGAVSMALNLYDVATGGATLYTETQTVTVTNGVFNVQIGSVTALSLPFDVSYWLGVTVGTDPEMSPRQPVAASAYAIRSASTESLAPGATVPASQITGAIGSAANFTGTLVGDVTGTQGATAISPATVTGKALTGFASAAGTISATDSILTAINKLNGNVALKAPLIAPAFTGPVGIGTASPATALHLSTAAAASEYLRINGPNTQVKGLQLYSNDNALDWEIRSTATSRELDIGILGGDGLMRIQRGGNVGIATPSPGSKLTVAGVTESSAGGGFKFPDPTGRPVRWRVIPSSRGSSTSAMASSTSPKRPSSPTRVQFVAAGKQAWSLDHLSI